ncbi:hypothetical protein, partial [Staphylococcus aureus]
ASIVCEHVVAFVVEKSLLDELQSNYIEQFKQQIIERRQ